MSQDYSKILDAISFNDDGLVPTIAQDADKKRRPDDGLDEQGCRDRNALDWQSLLLDTLPTEALAQRGNLRSAARADRLSGRL